MTARLLQAQGAEVTAADLEYLPHERADQFEADEDDDDDTLLRAAFGV